MEFTGQSCSSVTTTDGDRSESVVVGVEGVDGVLGIVHGLEVLIGL